MVRGDTALQKYFRFILVRRYIDEMILAFVFVRGKLRLYVPPGNTLKYLVWVIEPTKR